MAEERVQRRLAAILAADVVGYSRLMGVDEGGTLAETSRVCRWSRPLLKVGGVAGPSGNRVIFWKSRKNPSTPWTTT